MNPPRHLLESVLLVLQFDGSLRPPRDPGFPTQKLGRLASCSAALLKDDRIVAVGGRTLPLFPGMTSADAEFEGLLMGLEFLCSDNRCDEEKLVVQGDCKVVIDLMNQQARPRKLESKYDAAVKCLGRLGVHDIDFQHIMRESNGLCDSVCGKVIEMAVEQAFLQLSADAEHSVGDTLNRYFGKRSIIPFSQRLKSYCRMVERAREDGDGLGLQQLGLQLESDAKQWPSDSGEPCRQALLSSSIKLQIEGCELKGDDKVASKLRRKYRFVLAMYAESSGFTQTIQQSGSTKQGGGFFSADSSENLVALKEWKQKAGEIFLVHRAESMRDTLRSVWVTP